MKLTSKFFSGERGICNVINIYGDKLHFNMEQKKSNYSSKKKLVCIYKSVLMKYLIIRLDCMGNYDLRKIFDIKSSNFETQIDFVGKHIDAENTI